MDIHTRLPFDALSPWYFAVRWARMTLQQRLDEYKTNGWDWFNDYDLQTLERLESLESFLQVTWNDTVSGFVQTAKEPVSHE